MPYRPEAPADTFLAQSRLPLPCAVWTPHTHPAPELQHSICFRNAQPETVVPEWSEKAAPLPEGWGAKRSWIPSLLVRKAQTPCRVGGPGVETLNRRNWDCVAAGRDQMVSVRTKDWMVTAKPTNVPEKDEGHLGAGAGS